MNDELTPLELNNNSPFRNTIAYHFEQARNVEMEATRLEQKIDQLTDQCDQCRKTIYFEKKKLDKTRASIRFGQTTKPNKQNNNIMNLDTDYSKDPKLRAAKREVKDLELEIKRVKDQTLQYQSKANRSNDNYHTLYNTNNRKVRNDVEFAKTISPQISHHLEKQYENENAMQIRVRELREEIQSWEERQLLANRILALPIDETLTDELLTENSERSLLKAEERFNSSSPNRSYTNIDELQNEVDALIQNNLKRKEILVQRKRKIENEKKKTVSNKTILKPIKKTQRKAVKASKINSSNKNEINQKINVIFERIKTRGEKLDKEENEINRIEIEYFQHKNLMDEQWRDKMDALSDLSNKGREIQSYFFKIQTKMEQISEAISKYDNLLSEKAMIKRNENQIGAYKNEEEAYLDHLKVKKERLLKEQKEINNKERELKKKRSYIDKLSEQLKKQEIEEQMMISRVELIENQLEQYINEAEFRQFEVTQEMTELKVALSASKVFQSQQIKNESQIQNYSSFSSSFEKSIDSNEIDF